MPFHKRAVVLAFALVASCGVSWRADGAEAKADTNSVRTLNTPRDFPVIASKADWQRRAKEIREQILVSCGLWPLPEKAPLDAHIFGKIERDGYTVEKVYIRTYPGFYLAGNLYRPLHVKGKAPGILNPHGHWKEGRFADTTDGSIAARCISFARQGMVAFSYDMLGFNDTHFADSDGKRAFYDTHRQFDADRTNLLWNISPMGVQTWDSIRALDFLESLPEVDKHRLACTGESGGGTQTYILGAVDDRLAAQAPVVMVSHTMQGGCSCENAPALRVEYSNMEFAAAPAPRPQIIVGASGDWTKDTLTVEGPAIAGIYQLFDAADKFKYVRFDFGHNYNRTSREAVYAWFDKVLLHHAATNGLAEQAYTKEPDEALRVFPDGKLPPDAMTEQQFVESLKAMHRRELDKMLPKNKKELARFKSEMMPAWEATLQLTGFGENFSNRPPSAAAGPDKAFDSHYTAPNSGAPGAGQMIVVIIGPKPPTARLEALLAREGHGVFYAALDFAAPTNDQFADFFSTYNRTYIQEQVRQVVAICGMARTLGQPRKFTQLVLVGEGQAGLWALLAAPAADAVIADCQGVDSEDDSALLAPTLFCPGIRNIGGFEGAALLAAPHPILFHNAGEHFGHAALSKVYGSAGAEKKCRIESKTLEPDDWMEWLRSTKLN